MKTLKHPDANRQSTLFTLSLPAFRKGRRLFLLAGMIVFLAFLSLLSSILITSPELEITRVSGVLMLSASIPRLLLIPFGFVSALFLVLFALNLWAFFAKERISVTPEGVLLSKTLFILGHTYHLNPDCITKVAYIPSTKSISQNKRNQTFRARGFHEGKIALTCNGRIYSFGRAMEDREAAELADTLEALIREQLSSFQQFTESQISLTPAK